MNKFQNEDIKLFIVGFPRSGTTVLANTISKHLRLVIPPETRFYYELAFRGRKDGSQVLELINQSERLKDILSEEVSSSLFLKDKQYNSEQVLTAILHKWREINGLEENFLGEKSPIHQLYCKEIVEAFPNCLIVNINRNPEDVVESVINANWGYKSRLYVASLYRYRRKRFMRSIQEIKSNIFDVEYSEFVRDPINVVSRLSQRLDIPFRENYEEHTSSLSIPAWEHTWKNDASKAPFLKSKFNSNENGFISDVMKCILGENFTAGSSYSVILISLVVYSIVYSKVTAAEKVKKIFGLNKYMGNKTVKVLKKKYSDES